jgi:hypothetical protein
MAIRVGRGSELGPSRTEDIGSNLGRRKFDKKAPDTGGVTVDGAPDCTGSDSADDCGAGSFYGDPSASDSEDDSKE